MMKMKAREQLDAYYEQAESWGKDQQAALAGSRRVAWIVAAVFGLIALIEAFALWQLAPLKTVEPYTLLVDKQTGYVQALKPLEASQIAGNTALTQSFLVQYVIGRESFDINAIQANYRKVALWSFGQARQDYVAGSQASNPDSLLARMPRSSILETRVKSVTPMAGNNAMVRFDTIRRDGGGNVSPPQAWVAMIQYRYSNEPMSAEDRFVNPLGFQVTRYQRSAEALQPAQPGDVAPQVQATRGAAGTEAPNPLAPALNRPTPAPTPPARKGGVEVTL
ncbi:virB8 family protein [Sphingomonas sp.]|uniref:virB8 family protein n=1 Tax=Sphingomonas sp. TaxID=28214 RepID=UPI0025F9F406|nr:type IV secretion system protein [Sphingomonas sp.]